MIVLHALLTSNAELFLWAESSDRYASRPRRRPRRTLGALPPYHPFAQPDDELLRQPWGGLAICNPSAQAPQQLWLPSLRAAPVSSPQLLVDGERAVAEAPELLIWRVPGLEYTPDQTHLVLDDLEEGLPAGLVAGDSVRYWLEARKLAWEWVARGRVVPALQTERSGHSAAYWRPFVHGDDDLARRRLLARAMPPLCRALLSGNEEERPAAQILDDFLQTAVAAYVGRALHGVPAPPLPRRSRDRLAMAGARLITSLYGGPHYSSPDPESTAQLNTLLATWTNATAPAEGALRTCLRLEEPAQELAEDGSVVLLDPHWRLRFMLQASDDRSLLVPAAEVWGQGASVVHFLQRSFENPQERLLADLGRAVRLFPDLELALRQPRPADLPLDTAQAYDFLRHSAPLLEEAGLSVLVPPWWKKPAVKVGARLRVQSPQARQGGLGMNCLVDYRWELALGDETLGPEEFARLAALKVPLVQIRGQWVELKPEEIEVALAFFRKRAAAGQMPAAEVLRLASGEDSPVGLPVVGLEVEGWLSPLREGAEAISQIEPLPVPPSFRGSLRPYQVRGLAWLAFLDRHGLGGCLADDMGLGKTIQLIALLLHERAGAPAPPAPTLLICPMSVVGNWMREVQRFAPSLRVLMHHGSGRLGETHFAEEAGDYDLVITTYSLAARDAETLGRVSWGRIALDEAQNIKNSGTRQAQAIRQLPAARRVALTGTPVENRLSELWSIMEFLNPGYLGQAADFHRRFALPIERYRDEERAARLKQLVQPFVLRRLKTDRSIVPDLPDKIESAVYCNLTREQASLYQAVIDEMIERIEQSAGIERRGLVLATMTKLKQVCNHPAHFLQDRSPLPGRSGKLARLAEMLEEVVAAGDQALVFTQYAEMGELLKGYLQECLAREVLFLHGGVPRAARDALVARFQSLGAATPVFLLSLKAGGTGLNLTAASHVFHFDRWWNPAVESQASDRAYRIGQHKNVQVHKFVCVGTLEERIDSLIEEKKALAASVIGAGESWLTELSTSELRDLFALGREAVAEE